MLQRNSFEQVEITVERKRSSRKITEIASNKQTESKQTETVLGKILEPLNDFGQLKFGENLYTLDSQVVHHGSNSISGHYTIMFHDDGKVILVDDDLVNIDAQRITNNDPNCSMLLYRLDEDFDQKLDDSVQEKSDGSCGKSDDGSSNSDKSDDGSSNSDKSDDGSSNSDKSDDGSSGESDDGSSDEFPDLAGFKWARNSCAPDTHFSLLRLINFHYFNKTQKKKFKKDWPVISEIIFDKSLSSANRKMRNLVYNQPTPFRVGIFMGLSGLQRHLFGVIDPYKEFPSSLYFQYSTTIKCINGECTRNGFERFIEDHSHTFDLHFASKDSPPVYPLDSFNDRLNFLLNAHLENKFNLGKYAHCHFCQNKGTVGSINTSHKPSLLIISSQSFMCSDIYLPNNIIFGDENYKLVAVAYFVDPGHYTGKLRYIDNVIYDYDGMHDSGKFKKTSDKDFKINIGNNVKAELLYYIQI